MPFDERFLNGMGAMSAIVDSGSFVGAADVLGMTQPGVSRAIARLEARLGVRLFDRSTRTVKLTDEGRRFYERITPLLCELEEVAAVVSGSSTQVRGRLRVNIDPLFSRLILGPRLGTLMEKYPELKLELVTRDRLGDMIADGFDLAIRFGEQKSSTLVARKLLETRITTVAAPSYVERFGRPKTPMELQSGRHICIEFRDPRTGQAFEWEFHRGRKRITVATAGRLTVNDAGTQHSVCLAGHGIAQVIALGVEALLAKGRLVDLFPDWPDERYSLYALYPSRHHVPAKVRAFLDFIRQLIDQTG